MTSLKNIDIRGHISSMFSTARSFGILTSSKKEESTRKKVCTLWCPKNPGKSPFIKLEGTVTFTMKIKEGKRNN